MSMLTTRPMSMLVVEFNELYARHLCRHSQLGNNVTHLIALFAIWYAIYGFLYWLVGIEWVLVVPALVYLAIVAPNVPIRIFGATTLFLALMVVAAWCLPAPWWAYLIMIPTFYKLQAWSHKFYIVESDMTEFNKKYAKGSVLFVVLLIYEVPMVLNFLFFALSPGTSVPELSDEDQEKLVAKAS